MPTFRCSWCQTRSEHPQPGVLVVCPECGIKFNAIDWGATRLMGTYKTDQNIQDEDIAYRMNYRGPKMPFNYRVDADMKGRFTVSLNRLTRDDVERLLVFLRDHHEQWLQMSSRRDWSENMAHQFAIGDIVRLNGNSQEAEVIGFKVEEGSTCLLLQVKFTVSKDKMYFPENSVVLVRSGGAAQANHPSKIET